MKTKNRARILILNQILSFPTLGHIKWSDDNPKIGDLVSINCAPPTKYYLSWLRDYDYNSGNPKYLLESIEDGSLCWWDNIGVSYYDRSRIDSPLFHWDDDQYSFNDRFERVAYKKNHAYFVLPMLPVFDEDNSVTLNVRIRYGLSNFSNPKTYPNYRKVTIKMMDEYYKESESKYETMHANNQPADSAEQKEWRA